MRPLTCGVEKRLVSVLASLDPFKDDRQLSLLCKPSQGRFLRQTWRLTINKGLPMGSSRSSLAEPDYTAEVTGKPEPDRSPTSLCAERTH